MESLEGRLAPEFSRAGVPGLSIGIVKGSTACWVKGFGFADIPTQTPAAPETVYMWFSMTKLVTATAVMQLCDKGRLQLDDPVREYIQNFPTGPRSKQATIRHLLNHSSGLRNPIPLRWVHLASETGPEPDEFLKQLLAKHGKLRSRPGEKASYSNIGYVALGAVISMASGQRYKDYVLASILKPLGMQQTNFTYTPDMLRNAATGYQKRLSVMGLLLPYMRIPKGVLNGKRMQFVSFKHI